MTDATTLYSYDLNWTEESLALYMQAVIRAISFWPKRRVVQEVAASCLDHLHRYLEMLFNRSKQKGKRHEQEKSRERRLGGKFWRWL